MSRFRAPRKFEETESSTLRVYIGVSVWVCEYVSVFAWLFGYEILTDLTIDNPGHVESRDTEGKRR